MASRSAFNQPINLIGPKVTTSAFSSGPPSSPSDGDIWIASNVDANGTRWQFQYNAGSVSSYKWEFIGGSPLQASRGSTDAITSNNVIVSDTNLGTITPGRAGEYFANFNVWIISLPANVLGYVMKNGSQIGNWGAIGGAEEMLVMAPSAFALTATDNIGMGYLCNNASSFSAGPRAFTIYPRRVS